MLGKSALVGYLFSNSESLCPAGGGKESTAKIILALTSHESITTLAKFFHRPQCFESVNRSKQLQAQRTLVSFPQGVAQVLGRHGITSHQRVSAVKGGKLRYC